MSINTKSFKIESFETIYIWIRFSNIYRRFLQMLLRLRMYQKSLLLRLMTNQKTIHTRHLSIANLKTTTTQWIIDHLTILPPMMLLLLLEAGKNKYRRTYCIYVHIYRDHEIVLYFKFFIPKVNKNN